MPSLEPTILVSPDRSVAVTADGPSLRALTAATGEEQRFELPSNGNLIGCGGDVFAIRTYQPTPALSVRRLSAPGVDLATVRVATDERVEATGDEQWLEALPPVVTLGIDRSLRHDGGTFRVRRLADPLPEWATDPEAFQYAAACPDGLHVVVCGYRYGDALLVWNTASGRTATEVTLLTHGVMGGAFRPRSDELWIAQIDTIFRIDTHRWAVTDAKRVRSEPTGSFVAALAFDADGSRLAASHSLRRLQPLRVPAGVDVPWYAPIGGQLLVIDPDGFEVTHTAAHDAWMTAVAWLNDDDIVGVEWGRDHPLAIARPSPASYDLHPPRPPGTFDWR